MKKLILLLFIPLVFACGKREEVLGCTDSRAINYDPNATVMKDSCCVVKNKKMARIKIDNSKYKNVKYKSYQCSKCSRSILYISHIKTCCKKNRNFCKEIFFIFFRNDHVQVYGVN